MTSHRDYFEVCLGKDIRELIPLITEALVALDRPGTRALRRKIDKGFNCLVWGYGSLRRCTVDESEWDALRPTLPRYERATPAWPGKAAYRARNLLKVRSAAASDRPAETPAPSPANGLRLVVDNAPARRRVEAPTFGGAA